MLHFKISKLLILARVRSPITTQTKRLQKEWRMIIIFDMWNKLQVTGKSHEAVNLILFAQELLDCYSRAEWKDFGSRYVKDA